MAIFDIEKDELLRLSDTLLEELIARLAEAEVALHGHSPAYVNWSGSITAPDGGIDIHVQVPVNQLNTGFIVRPDTIFQAKKHRMSKTAIEKEMCTGKALSLTISEQARKQGSYIIVSLEDDCSPSAKAARLKVMQDAVKDDPNKNNIHLDFYDRSKLLQWLRQHPSVLLWANRKLGRGYSGWQAYGAWSCPPEGAVDTLISAAGVRISLPSGGGKNLSIKDAIGPMRQLVRSTNKAVRITGLSGVGKTRIIQALFDETIETNALDRTLAVYVDMGDEPEPSANAMLDRLIAEARTAIMVLDNCPLSLHSTLAAKVTSYGGKITLITIEYDIQEDKPQTTEVIHIEAVGPEVAEQLLLRRFPGIGQVNARRIAEFADGNARVSLAIAERVEDGETLALLSDSQLFNRLFEQRNQPDEGLQEQAEILSLVYSFSSLTPDKGDSELDILGSLADYKHKQLFKTLKKLSDRHILQKRSHWRAILPHAIANRLASSALESFPIEVLITTFETPERERLLLSFAHRLGLLHDHPVAKEIVAAWLKPEGLLGNILALEETPVRMLEYIAPVVPQLLLNRIEMVLSAANFKGRDGRYDPRWSTILRLLQALAYEPIAFERCSRLLVNMADYEAEITHQDSARHILTMFFQPYLSGTHASLKQRISLIEECLSSAVEQRRTLGMKMLSSALSDSPWTGSGIYEFGARPRDYGAEPDYDELVAWRSAFINIAVRSGISGDTYLENSARTILANAFSGLWCDMKMGEILTDAARALHSYLPWGEGWKTVRTKLFFKRQDSETSPVLIADLEALEKELRPIDLLSSIKFYVLSKGHHHWVLDDEFNREVHNRYNESEERLAAMAYQLGHEFAASKHHFDELKPNLFSSEWMPYRRAFGKGVAQGSLNLHAQWQCLITELEQDPLANEDCSIFLGFIEGVDLINQSLAHEFLDQCALHFSLRRVLVGLHPQRDFTETDLNRCVALLDDADTRPFMYGDILWREKYAKLPDASLLALAERLILRERGDEVVLEALGMKLHGRPISVDTLGYEFRNIGLKASIQVIQNDTEDRGGFIDHHMESVIATALRFDGNEELKVQWLDAIFSAVDKHYGHMHGYEKSIEATVTLMPEAFLTRIFDGTEDQKQMRLFFLSYGTSSRPLLAGVDYSILIKWCSANPESGVWRLVAQGMDPWSNSSEENSLILHEGAITFLEAAPDSHSVLESFAEYVTPSTRTGSLTTIFQARADALGELIKHERRDISGSAKKVYEKLTLLIEHQRIRDHHEDQEREQRFE
ncbi:hypothetical protein [Leclercia adecarboxylata]|uniref:hypothetical protein n=1 Tax=Leclercia adecarboxylata TaxID=83655 RepID=UPI00384B04BA